MPIVDMPKDLHAFLRAHANETVGRFFGVERLTAPAASRKSGPNSRRQPKADLLDLTHAGLLRKGQRVFLHDHQGRRVPGAEAEIGSGKRLVWRGERYSMSKLAGQLLEKQGYSGDSVRGPAHWFTEAGESIKSIWEQYQKNRHSLKSGAA